MLIYCGSDLLPLWCFRPFRPSATQGLVAEKEAEAKTPLLEEELALTLHQLAGSGIDAVRIAGIHTK